jgi:hypothetical protein
MVARRFPPPWTVEELVTDSLGRVLIGRAFASIPSELVGYSYQLSTWCVIMGCDT